MTTVLPDRTAPRSGQPHVPVQGAPAGDAPAPTRPRSAEPATQLMPVVGHEPVPGIVLDVDVAAAIPALPAARSGRPVATAWVLVRAFTEPLGQSIVDIPPGGLTAGELAARIERDFGPEIRLRVLAAGGDPGQGVPVDGIGVARPPAHLTARAAVLADPPRITVVVCTRERPVQLRRCLESLVSQAYPYPAYRILVVDNAPRTDATRAAVRDFQRRFHVDYLVQPRPGLSRARNAAVAAAPGDILAFTDDDVVADRFWLAELARGFARASTADALTGLILPAELETTAQVWYELHAGQRAVRGFAPTLFDEPTDAGHPLPPLGSGANMAFRPGVLESLGGFDEALGPGTPAKAAEDTLAFLRLLRDGGTLAYRPAALVRHAHHRDLDDLRARLVGYGTGLSAAYAALVGRDRRVLGELLRDTPRMLRELRSGTPAGVAAAPRELRGLVRSGVLRGPAAYLRGRRELLSWPR